MDWFCGQHSKRLACSTTLGPLKPTEMNKQQLSNLRLGVASLGSSCPVSCCYLYAFVAVYYAQIKKIESHVIKDHEEYSMIAFHLNAEGKPLNIASLLNTSCCLANTEYKHGWQQQTNCKVATASRLNTDPCWCITIAAMIVVNVCQVSCWWDSTVANVSLCLQERASTGCIGFQVNTWRPSKSA